jgi:hypothetical protein
MVNVFAALSINQVVQELEDADSPSPIMIDSCKHKQTKLITILVCYFLPQQEVKVKILEFTDLSGGIVLHG